jgi:hypothetical protein
LAVVNDGGTVWHHLWSEVGTTGPYSVGNATASTHAVNLGQSDARYAALLGNAANKFSVAAGVAATDAVNVGQFVKSLAGSGYQKLPGGLIMQWASVAQTSGVEGAVAITYPTAFPNASLIVIPGLDVGTWSTPPQFNFSGQTSGFTASGFNYYLQPQNTTSGSGTYYLTYIAIGY